MSELPFVSVEAYLRQFFLDLYRDEDFLSLKKELPLGLVYSSDVDIEDRTRLLEAFKDNGYGNVANIDFASSALECLQAQNRLQSPYSCLVENDGQDVLLGVYISQTAERLATGMIADLPSAAYRRRITAGRPTWNGAPIRLCCRP